MALLHTKLANETINLTKKSLIQIVSVQCFSKCCFAPMKALPFNQFLLNFWVNEPEPGPLEITNENTTATTTCSE